jgi:hypothetical protein
VALAIDDVFIEAADARHELDRRARLEAVADRPVLIHDRKDLSGLGFHDDNGSGVTAECIDRRVADIKIFARRVVLRDIFDRRSPKTAFECEASLPGFAGRLLATTLFGQSSLTSSFRFTPALSFDPSSLGSVLLL